MSLGDAHGALARFEILRFVPTNDGYKMTKHELALSSRTWDYYLPKMGKRNEKINQLQRLLPEGLVVDTPWLDAHGYRRTVVLGRYPNRPPLGCVLCRTNTPSLV